MILGVNGGMRGSSEELNPSGQLDKHGGCMKAHETISELWNQFRLSIDAADADGKKLNSADGHAECNALHDYTSDRNWRLFNLLGRESANERQHRGVPYYGRGAQLSVRDAAMLNLMAQASLGAWRGVMPSAHLFLTMRPTAIEAEVIGYLCRKHLSHEWREALGVLDYSKLMQDTNGEFVGQL